MDLLELVRQARNDSEKWFPNKANDAFYHAASMAGEVGEVINLLKKVERGSLTYEDVRLDLADEVADVFTYLLSLCAALDIDIEMVYAGKREFNVERYER